MVDQLTYSMKMPWEAIFCQLDSDAAEVLLRAELPVDYFERGLSRIPDQDLYMLWEAMRELAAQRGLNLPVLAAQCVSDDSFHPAMFAGLCCQDLNKAFSRLSEYKRLIGPMRLGVQVLPDVTILAIEWDGGAPPPDFALTELLFWVNFARIATRRAVDAEWVELATELPVCASVEAFAGGDVLWGESWRIAFSSEDASSPFMAPSAGAWEFFDAEDHVRLGELAEEASMGERVRACLVEALPAGGSGVCDVAERLGYSRRTLQRQLGAEGLTFRDVLQRTRESLARHYLQRSDLPVSEIAFLLGFKHTNSFYRALSSWVGETPEQVRSGAQGLGQVYSGA